MKKLTVQDMNRLSVEDFMEAEKVPLIAVLDNVRSRHNVGAVFRTADAFRLEAVWLCGCCAQPPDQEIHKTALGAELTVPWRYFADTKGAVNELRREGYKILAVEQADESCQLEDFETLMGEETNKIAVIFGHEVFGVQQEVVDSCDNCIEIPQYGTKHSLNVSVAAGIVLYQMSNKLRK